MAMPSYSVLFTFVVALFGAAAHGGNIKASDPKTCEEAVVFHSGSTLSARAIVDGRSAFFTFDDSSWHVPRRFSEPNLGDPVRFFHNVKLNFVVREVQWLQKNNDAFKYLSSLLAVPISESRDSIKRLKVLLAGDDGDEIFVNVRAKFYATAQGEDRIERALSVADALERKLPQVADLLRQWFSDQKKLKLVFEAFRQLDPSEIYGRTVTHPGYAYVLFGQLCIEEGIAYDILHASPETTAAAIINNLSKNGLVAEFPKLKILLNDWLSHYRALLDKEKN